MRPTFERCPSGYSPLLTRQLVLDDDEVHVWYAPLRFSGLDTYDIESVIATQELARAHRYRDSQVAGRYLVSHLILRCLLGRYLDLQPASLRFRYNRFGKPALLKTPRLRFSLARSGDLALLAFCRSEEIGVDLEAVQPAGTELKIAERHFSLRERRLLASLPKEQLSEAFFRCWTLKEAYIKGLGTGLSIPLNSFDVSSAVSKTSYPPSTTRHRIPGSRWTVQNLNPCPGYAGAIALVGDSWRLKCFRWPGKNLPADPERLRSGTFKSKSSR